MFKLFFCHYLMNIDCDSRIYNPYGVYLKSYYINLIKRLKSNSDIQQIQTLKVESIKQKEIEQLKQELKQNQDFKNQVKTIKQDFEKQIKQLNEQKQQQLKEQEEKLKREFEEFKQKQINPKMAAPQLGELGESWIYDILKDFGYVRTGMKDHVCDGHIEFEHCILLFEIKNKTKIKHDDIDKFKYDLEYYQKNQTSKKVLGVFISLNSDFQELNLNLYESYIPKKCVSKELLIALIKLIQYYDQILGVSEGLESKDIQIKLESLESVSKRSIEIINQLENVMTLEQQNYSEIEHQISILKGTIECIDLKTHEEQEKLKQLNKYLSETKKWKCKDIKNILNNYKPNGLKSFTKTDIQEYIDKYLNQK